MRRKTMALGLGLAVAVGGAGFAVAQQPSAQAPRAEAGAKVNKERGQRGDRGPQRGQQRGDPALRGIELSEAQRTQVQSLRQQQREEMRTANERLRANAPDMRALRQSGDTAAIRAHMTRVRAELEPIRTRHQSAVRQLLTAEQAAQYDRNVAEMRERGARMIERRGERGPRTGGEPRARRTPASQS